MPLVAHSDLPTFERLKNDGTTVLPPERAQQQDIRELHIGLLNMMPDAALQATERQFFRLVGESNQIAQFHVHPFTIDELARSPESLAYIDRHYSSFEELRQTGLDALIITGANVTQPDLSAEPFWAPLVETINWALEHVTSTLCSCLATHAVLKFRHNQSRRRLEEKCWGVFSHGVVDRQHPLVRDVNTRFDVPHSRFNDVGRDQFDAAGLRVLVESEDVGVHLAVTEDGFRGIFMQGHPEYDTLSLLKEYKREVTRFLHNDRDYPSFPENYLTLQSQAILNEYEHRVASAKVRGLAAPEFPEALLTRRLDNTWRDSGSAVVDKWIGSVYQITGSDRREPFMEGVDPKNPLGLLNK